MTDVLLYSEEDEKRLKEILAEINSSDYQKAVFNLRPDTLERVAAYAKPVREVNRSEGFGPLFRDDTLEMLAIGTPTYDGLPLAVAELLLASEKLGYQTRLFERERAKEANEYMKTTTAYLDLVSATRDWIKGGERAFKEISKGKLSPYNEDRLDLPKIPEKWGPQNVTHEEILPIATLRKEGRGITLTGSWNTEMASGRFTGPSQLYSFEEESFTHLTPVAWYKYYMSRMGNREEFEKIVEYLR